MKTVKVVCDGCGSDLTTRTNSVDYRLVLDSENKPGYGAGFYTDMGIYPAVDRPYHFCGLKCLDRWRDHERVYASERKRRSDQWADEKGTRHEGGMRSYPAPPDDILKSWDAECRAAANAAFPLS